MRTLDVSSYIDVVVEEGAEIGRLCRAGSAAAVRHCPDWTGADLLAHLVAYQRFVTDLVAGTTTVGVELPDVGGAEALSVWDAEHAAFAELLRGLDPATPVPNWSILPDVADFWQRRSSQEFAVHRWDAGTTVADEPAPIRGNVARDGIEEYFDTLVDTAVAAGMPQAQHPATLRYDLTDLDLVLERHIRAPGPVTTLRGTASDLLLGLWHRRDATAYVVDGDRALIAAWPHV